MDEAALKDNAKPKESFPQQAAKFSAYAPICLVFLTIAFNVGKYEGIVLAVLNIALMVSGLLAAIFALLSIPRVGTKGVLGYALVGLVINGLFVCLTIGFFMISRDIVAQRQQVFTREEAMLLPAVFDDSETIFDEDVGYSFEVPAGFTPEDKQPGVQYSYTKISEDSGLYVFNIEHLGGYITPEKVPIELIREKSPFPAGTTFEEIEANWQGFTLDGYSANFNSAIGQITVYAVQIPISKQAIQIHVGGPAANDFENRKLFDKILRSIHGKSNWTK